ncbi:hypothetical protein A1Q1_01723 [Trichosporon asahii var. asahii CBS 2479]|uniref:DNA repair protein RAD50 n=1 Tax=Trichosporon asahii var. asahii (strain ATCC 90039 / CBS 2479 / JCM 2466 / KCTC 7840 / NBRC 103889/ NCYC 2677 / UAMH 7654) TaxID=1186058 RepID=J6EWT9_TRIAS|nr:hypothetical protein A1Q1_01723 [Trichosporon asahii var. asahii CBS 2479]EJT49074.1 hypothetical protein A1Q1_01723 [Trichosporon asahii var. asahii CBS 2479]
MSGGRVNASRRGVRLTWLRKSTAARCQPQLGEMNNIGEGPDVRSVDWIWAALNKLAIRGIRSFDDKHVQVIEFYSPLTVIVGHNGSGKTVSCLKVVEVADDQTIIECLKYATTGDLPPNTKGADNQMANEKEVKAQVRLRFWNVNRQRMTVTRSLQVTTKKTGGLTMKTLEGLLAKTDGNDGKCSEMDEEVPLLLGVSKAILENVIFCHQEDSNWPLSEPAALKKKFDDIFEATKYTKALDNIKQLKKQGAQDLKVENERLTHLKKDKNRADADIEEMIAKENAKQTEVERLNEVYQRIKEENFEFAQQATSFNTIFEHVTMLEKEKKMHESYRDTILEGTTILNDLKRQYENFDAHLNSIESKRDKQTELRDKEDHALRDLRRRENNLISTQGGLQANRKRNVKEREAAVRNLAKQHNFSGFDYSPLEDTKVADFIEKLQELVRKAESDLKRIQMDGVRKERELQAELDHLSSVKTAAVTTKQSKLDQILSSRIHHMEATFDSVSSVDADISVLANDLEASEQRRDRLDEEIRNAKYDDQMRERGAAIRQKELEKDKINAELSALNRQADTRAQLSIKRTEIESKTAQVDASRRERELQEAEATAAASNRTLSQLQTSLHIAKQSLQSKTGELTPASRPSRTPSRRRRRRSTSVKKTSVKFYKKILDLGKTKKKCLGCDRAIHDNEKPHFEAYRCSTGNMDEVKEELEQWQTELTNLRKHVPSVAQAKLLKEKEIPDLQRQIKEESAKLETVQTEVEEKAKLATCDLQNMRSAATVVTRTVGEIKDLKIDVQRLERDLQGSGSVKTVEEVQREREQSSLSSEKEFKSNALHTVREEISRKSFKLAELRTKQEKRRMDELALKEQQEERSKLQAELKELDAAAAAALAPWREKTEAMERFRAERQSALDDANVQVDSYRSSATQLESKNRACQTYISEGNDRKLRENEAQIDDLRREIEATSATRAAIDKQVTALNDDISRASGTRKNIKSNIDYRGEMAKIEEVDKELASIDIEGAAQARRDFNKKYAELSQEETDAQGKWQLASGVLLQMTENRKKAEHLLKTEYRDIEKVYIDQLIKTKMGEHANADLDKYGKALDNAGQKVLASIIIRLALAESFGQGCGVLALDEPTTNLDQENINALAESLAEIIRERRRQANFQLIVITHDEGFLQRLAAHDVLEYYWRVSRDASQKSTLERQRVGI